MPKEKHQSPLTLKQLPSEPELKDSGYNQSLSEAQNASTVVYASEDDSDHSHSDKKDIQNVATVVYTSEVDEDQSHSMEKDKQNIATVVYTSEGDEEQSQPMEKDVQDAVTLAYSSEDEEKEPRNCKDSSSYPADTLLVNESDNDELDDDLRSADESLFSPGVVGSPKAVTSPVKENQFVSATKSKDINKSDEGQPGTVLVSHENESSLVSGVNVSLRLDDSLKQQAPAPCFQQEHTALAGDYMAATQAYGYEEQDSNSTDIEDNCEKIGLLTKSTSGGFNVSGVVEESNRDEDDITNNENDVINVNKERSAGISDSEIEATQAYGFGSNTQLYDEGTNQDQEEEQNQDKDEAKSIFDKATSVTDIEATQAYGFEGSTQLYDEDEDGESTREEIRAKEEKKRDLDEMDVEATQAYGLDDNFESVNTCDDKARLVLETTEIQLVFMWDYELPHLNCFSIYYMSYLFQCSHSVMLGKILMSDLSCGMFLVQ